MIQALVRWILSWFLKLFDHILGVILGLISPAIGSNFQSLVYDVSQHLESFWGFCISKLMFVRSMADINQFEMYLISELLIVTLLHKPLLIGIKLLVRWFKSLKG